ncbi:MAG TPA: nitrilase-related carbon-nitrogen hydrolase [Phycisphaerales bacterium]|nr:nitrilase-related carbon-nitrogen hydrolase [Phycisphaerales bacterium]
MKAHLVQLDIRWEDKPANRAAVERLLRAAHPAPGDLAVLPEMFDTGFSFRLDHTADTDNATLGFLSALAKDLRITIHGARTTIGPDNRGRNCATIVGPDGALLCEFEKIHPFTLGKEVEHFTGGDQVLTYPWALGTEHWALVSPAVCYDLRFPELFRLGLLKGAEIYAVGANWPASREAHRRALSIARAIENQAFVLSVNRCGADPHLEYGGGTIAISPRGEILGELGKEEAVLSVEIDTDDLRRWRRTFPAWTDHRLIGRTQ